MAIFAVISDQPNPAINDKIIASYAENDRYKLNDNVWLIVADKLAETIGQELGIAGGASGWVVVFGISPAYFGWHNKNLWEWLSLKTAK